MASDLISRQAVYEYLESKFNEYDISIFGNEFAGKILDGIDDIPTAYDVDAVVGVIKKFAECDDECAKTHYLGMGCEACAWNTIMDLVRKGGVNG